MENNRAARSHVEAAAFGGAGVQQLDQRDMDDTARQDGRGEEGEYSYACVGGDGCCSLSSTLAAPRSVQRSEFEAGRKK